MASKQYLGEGSNINRPPNFNGEHYDFWKIRMRIFIESQDLEIWDAIENGPFIPSHLSCGIVETKPRSAWDNEDKRKVQYDLKAKNIITSALGMDEFFRISNCKTAKEMWETLETTHEGTDEVKRSRLNTLSQEYELFRMLPGEKIQDLQKRFTHLTNHLIALGKDLSTNDLNLKVLRSLNRNWQPKVTAISEKKSLSKMSLATLFGKLQEHELELGRLEQNEEIEKKHKSIALNTVTKDRNSDIDDDEDMILLAKRFNKFLKKSKNFKNNKFSRKNENSSSQNITCFECGKSGHIKADCPTLKKMDSYSKNFNNNKVNNYNNKTKKAYIVWDDNDISSSSDSDNEENAQIALMASHQSEDELDEVSNSFELHSYDELQEAFNELHDEFLKLSKICSKQKKTIVELESKVNSQNKLTSCNKCIEKESKIHVLTNEINTLNRSTKNLDKILLNQRPSNNKRGIGYSPNNNSGQNKTVFIKESVSKLPYVNERAVLKFKNSDFYTSPKNFKSNNLIYKYTCNYCNHHGHTPNNCYVKNYGVPKGKFVWVEKGTNIKGPKSLWVPKSKI